MTVDLETVGVDDDSFVQSLHKTPFRANRKSFG